MKRKRIGLDILGVAHKNFPLRRIRHFIPRGSAIGALDGTFGPLPKKVERLIRTGKFPIFRIHLNWDPLHRIVPMRRLIKRAKVYERIALKYPDIQIYLSHSLEHNERNRRRVMRRMSALRRYAPHCTPVNCIWRGVVLNGEINEAHGPRTELPKPFFVSMDGSLIGDTKSWLRANSAAKLRFLWTPRFNLRSHLHDTTPILRRAAAPRQADFKKLLRGVR